MTWAKAAEPYNQATLADAYVLLGREWGADVVPVGLAFQQSQAGNPTLHLHDLDGKHPTMAGSYLTACCFYTYFYRRSPSGLSRIIYDRGKEWLTIKEGEALYLQEIARRSILMPQGEK